MRTSFLDSEDKQLVALALEYESTGKRIIWKNLADRSQGVVSAADIRQGAGKPDENAGELLPTAVSSVIQMIGDISEDDVFLDVEAGLGNIVARFTLQTNAGQCLGIEKRAEVVRGQVAGSGQELLSKDLSGVAAFLEVDCVVKAVPSDP
ncbi:hypothetical protein PPTG_00592 [Phytophthora nicotianae INRA-310]|uniref:DOT1 domain-containing protein n=1 Tax=Phytophthora nicotianae (strain INRA-310) TaxID=761204 RepID=W2RFY6_PHYN3|nr:hypothetical protein PPTG_00592 [Phytophthora nicotianae INRA-310]ETN24156.1 hypothetical protein PPTG_00592 [Phytophthora nicotianae INRA-310]